MIARKMRRDDETVRIKKRAPVLLLLNGFGWIGFCLEGISLSLSLCFLQLKDGIVSEHSVYL